MKIENYTMELTGSSTFKSEETETLNGKVWVDPQNRTGNMLSGQGIILDLSEQGIKLSQTLNSSISVNEPALQASSEEIPDEADFKQRLLSDFIYMLTGKKLKFVKIKNVKEAGTSIPPLPASELQRAGWGINLAYDRVYKEEAAMSFSAAGKVKTADGREIDLELNLNLSRTFVSQTNISLKAGDALLDPLVINFNNAPVSLSGSKISFDINMDGSREFISVPGGSSGFLVLDKNKNGNIDDGSELFGPQTGNGFLELSEYDSDNNGWIDENDPVYDSLQIWQHDGSGGSTLIAVGKAGIGAIYLGSVETDFKYADSRNNTQGVLRQTGIYLKENGTAGTIQHIDLAI